MTARRPIPRQHRHSRDWRDHLSAMEAARLALLEGWLARIERLLRRIEPECEALRRRGMRRCSFFGGK